MVIRNRSIKKVKVHRKTFLSKIRFVTNNEEKASNSRFVWARLGNGYYGLSYMGVLNGFFSIFGYKYAFVVDYKKEIVDGQWIKAK